MDTVYAVIHVEYVFIAHILHKYWMRNSISLFYDVCKYNVTVYNMSFNSNCDIVICHLIVTVTWPRS